jgi:uncharacterized membrane protein YphA (DoxX/SURF4 family)
MKWLRFIYHVLILFAFLCALFIPFTFRYLPFQSEITHFLFEDLCVLLATKFESIHVANSEISSDSTTMYLLVLVLFILAVLVSVIFQLFNFWKTHQKKIISILQIILTYYLALILLKYGFDKVFKGQFYLPEPNTLYTPLGMLEKDILYWSTMGVSYSYNLFMGLMEVIPSLLLLHRKTRIFALFILFGVLAHVVFVNFSFDISVKLFSSFLWLLTLLLLTPHLKSIIQFFMLQQASTLTPPSGKSIIASPAYRIPIKAIVVLLFFAETLSPYLRTGHYNDDTAPRNYLHGAYEVTEIKANNTTVILPPVKRIFIHRRNYFIFQYADDTMEDFFLEISQVKGTFKLTDYEENSIVLHFTYLEDIGELNLWSDEIGWYIHTKTLSWKELPLLRPLFHWTVDEI